MKRKHFNWILGSFLTLLLLCGLVYGAHILRARAELLKAVARIEAKGGELGPRSIIQMNYTPTPRNVRQVSFRGEPLTDADLASLMDEFAHFPKLKSVDLRGTHVSDACLDIVGQIPELRTVYVANTAVTATAIERFKHAHPRVNVYSR